MTEILGFVAEPHKNGFYIVSPATISDGVITCHDPSGFLGSWEMKQGGVFFKSISGSCFCNETMSLASEYAKFKNGGI